LDDNVTPNPEEGPSGARGLLQSLFRMDYREIIRAQFQQRRERDPFYSLRTFSKDLNLTVQHVSRIFKGQKGLSKLKAFEVGRRLGLPHKESRLFQALVASQSGRGLLERAIGHMYLRKEQLSPASSELERKSINSLVHLPPIVKKPNSRAW
jgi:AraC-like DNA-binding protein